MTERRGHGIGPVQKFASQSAALLSTGLLSYVGGLALQVYLARELPIGEFGTWVVAFSFVEVISVAGLMGGDWLLLRQGSYYEGVGDTPRLRATLRLALLLSGVALTIAGIALFVLGPVIAAGIFNTRSLGTPLRLAAIVGPVFGLRQILLFGTQAFKSVRDAALIRNFAQPITRLTFVILAVSQTASPEAALLGLLGAELVLAGASALLLNRRVTLFGPTAGIEKKALILFASTVLGSRVVEGLRGQAATILIGALASVSSSGLFAASRRITQAPGLMTSAMNQVYSPIASELFLRNNQGELSRLSKSMARWIFLIAFPFFCLLVGFPEEILSLFGDSFRAANETLIILAIGMLFLIATGPVTTTLIVAGKPKLAFLDNVLAFVIEIGLGLWLIPIWGLNGAAVAATCGRFVNNVVPLVQVWRILRIHPYRLDFWKPAVAGLIALAAARILDNWLGPSGVSAVALAVVVTGLVYLLLLILFGVSRDDRVALTRFGLNLRKGWRREPQPSSDN